MKRGFRDLALDELREAGHGECKRCAGELMWMRSRERYINAPHECVPTPDPLTARSMYCEICDSGHRQLLSNHEHYENIMRCIWQRCAMKFIKYLRRVHHLERHVAALVVRTWWPRRRISAAVPKHKLQNAVSDYYYALQNVRDERNLTLFTGEQSDNLEYYEKKFAIVCQRFTAAELATLHEEYLDLFDTRLPRDRKMK